MKFLITLIGLLFVSGCAPTKFRYSVSINALSSPDFEAPSKYWLISGNKEVSVDDLQFQEYAAYVNHVLSSKGYEKVQDPKAADIIVLLDYGVSDPETFQNTYSVPTYGQTGVSSSTTYGTINTYGNMGSYSGTTTYTPTYGITGYNTHVKTETIYTRHITLHALDAKNLNKQAWTLTAASAGALPDLRSVFPAILAASKDWIGENTGSVLSTFIYVGDERINEVKGLVTKEETIEP